MSECTELNWNRIVNRSLGEIRKKSEEPGKKSEKLRCCQWNTWVCCSWSWHIYAAAWIKNVGAILKNAAKTEVELQEKWWYDCHKYNYTAVKKQRLQSLGSLMFLWSFFPVKWYRLVISWTWSFNQCVTYRPETNF